MNEYVVVVESGVLQSHDLMSRDVVIKFVSFDVWVSDAKYLRKVIFNCRYEAILTRNLGAKKSASNGSSTKYIVSHHHIAITLAEKTCSNMKLGDW